MNRNQQLRMSMKKKKETNNNFIPSKQAAFKLYSNPNCPYCTKVKIILAEKEIYIENIDIDFDNKPMELFEVNPYGQVPTLMGKDIILYDSGIICEFLEDRFPHPQLMSNFPIGRAQIRVLCKRLNQELTPLLATAIFAKDENKRYLAKVALIKAILLLIPVFKKYPYFMSEEYSVVDCLFAAILYCLPKIGITLPPRAEPIIKYKESIFGRDRFKKFLEAQQENKNITTKKGKNNNNIWR